MGRALVVRGVPSCHLTGVPTIETPGPRRFRWWLPVLALGVGCLLALVTGELAVRVYLFGPRALWPPTMNGIHQIGVSGMIRSSPDLDIQYELLPNLRDVRYKEVHVTTNAAGWRDQEYALAKPPGTFRVAVVGDSFTMADGVEIEDVYHSLLEERLNAQGGRHYEFLNFGVAGYQLPQYVAVIEKRALAWDPDLILVGFSTNDFIWFEEQAKILFSKPYEVKPTEHPFFTFHLGAWVQTRIAALRAGPDRQGEVPLAPMFRAHVDQQLDAMGAIHRRTGIPICVAFVNYYSAGLREVIAAVRAAAERNDLAFIDVSAAFPPVQSKRYFIYRDDGHPNVEGHRAFADVLFGYLLGSGLIPR
jgi:lysophospholipase L1-like esterase